MVGLGRLERPTSPLSGVRSNHLSYRPVPVCDETDARERNTPSATPQAQHPKTVSGKTMERGNEGGSVPPIGT
jgi:hypothetical protein